MDRIRLGFALTGSFCTFAKAFGAIKSLTAEGFDVYPIMSFNSYNISTRFGSCEDNRKKLRELTGREIIATIEDAEPIGPKKMFDALVVAPCSSNTLAKLAWGVNDTPVTMAVKSHVRNIRPVVLAISTNDALAAAAKNIGVLQNQKNFFFVPYSQDDHIAKPYSAVADFTKIGQTVRLALDGKQIQPMLVVR